MASKFQIPIAFKSDPRGLQQAQGALAGFGKKLAGIGAAVAAAFAVRAVFNFGKEAILAAEQVSTANNTLIAVAKATNVFGKETDKVTKSLIDFAKAQEMRIGVDENVVKNVQAQLLSFKKLSVSAGEVNGVFERTTKAAFDMAVVLKKDAGSQALALGKALEDPVRGLTALRRGGTVFTEEQQKVIKALVDSNDLLGAQTLILDELESQYGGAAEASANWSDRLTLAMGNIKESIGTALTPAFETFAKFLIEKVIPPTQKFFDEDFPKILEKLRIAGSRIKDVFEPIGDALKDALDIPEEASLLEGLLDKIATLPDNPVFTDLVDSIVELTPGLVDLLPKLTELVKELLPLMLLIVPFITFAVTLLVDIIGGLVGGFDDLSGEVDDFTGESKDTISMVDRISDAFRRFDEWVLQVRESLRKLIDTFKRWVSLSSGNTPSAAGQGGTSGGGGGRAVGGPVSANRSYMVGERGPEMFTPGAGGFITPNNRLGGGNSTNITINVNAGMGVDGARLGQEIVSAIRKYERVSGPVFASA
jgi:hypothetical protein